MSENVDVLAVLRDTYRRAHFATREEWTAAEQAIAAVVELIEREKAQREALEACERWFAKHSPTAPLINGGVAEHPMLGMIRAALGRAQGGA